MFRKKKSQRKINKCKLIQNNINFNKEYNNNHILHKGKTINHSYKINNKLASLNFSMDD